MELVKLMEDHHGKRELWKIMEILIFNIKLMQKSWKTINFMVKMMDEILVFHDFCGWKMLDNLFVSTAHVFDHARTSQETFLFQNPELRMTRLHVNVVFFGR